MDQLVDLIQITGAVNQDCRLRQIRWWTKITPIELNQFPAAASGAISTELILEYTMPWVLGEIVHAMDVQ